MFVAATLPRLSTNEAESRGHEKIRMVVFMLFPDAISLAPLPTGRQGCVVGCWVGIRPG
jgi:hypothetical protein